jgi:ATP-dependent Clp protease adaptor protein ClpS
VKPVMPGALARLAGRVAWGKNRERSASSTGGRTHMPDKKKDLDVGGANAPEAPAGATATKAKTKRKPKPKQKPPQPLPPWKVLLHNDDKNGMDYVVLTIIELTPLNEQDAVGRMVEAHKTGVAMLLVTHKERAELYQEQFQSKGLSVTIEPAE